METENYLPAQSRSSKPSRYANRTSPAFDLRMLRADLVQCRPKRLYDGGDAVCCRPPIDTDGAVADCDNPP